MSTIATPAAARDEIVKRNPRTGEVLYTVPEPTDAELAEVMDNARQAHAVLAAMSVHERIEETRKLKECILRHKTAIVDKLVDENGKCRTDALVGDVFTCLDLIEYYEKNAKKILADEKVHTPLMLMGKKSKIVYSPLGPVLVISPWNYPLNTALTPALCALLAGNSVIMKPSEWTPLRCLLDDMISKSGMLHNAMQVVHGGRETGRRLIDLGPAKIFFTGSVRAGKEIMKQAAEKLTPVELELGGKDPMVVFEDANLERAINGATWGALNNTGQGCTSVERCFVQEGVYEDFVARLKEKFGRLGTTDTFEGEDQGDLDIGCITTPFQLETIIAQVEEARERGADVWMAYEPKSGAQNFPPTIITKVDKSMQVQCEETFGPVITVTPFRTEDEAITLANDTIYGLSSSVWTSDMEKADRFVRAIEAGNVCVNDVMVTEGNSALPFGGVKQSGIGRYKSAVGLHNFCNIKAVMIDKGTKDSEANWYPYTREKYRLLTDVVHAAFSDGLPSLIRLAITGLKLDSLVKKQTL